MKNKTERNKVKRWIFKIFLILVLLFIFKNIVGIIIGISDYFKQSDYSTPYTYKIGEKDPEYVTYERTGFAQYKISFHQTKDNPETDYILLTTRNQVYPPLKWGYLEGPEKKVFIDYDDYGWVRIDTIVSNQYEIYPGFELWSGNKVLTLEERDSAKLADQSIWVLPFRLWVRSKTFNRIRYTEYLDWERSVSKDGKIVKRGR